MPTWALNVSTTFVVMPSEARTRMVYISQGARAKNDALKIVVDDVLLYDTQKRSS